MPNWLPPRLETETAVTIYSVLTYNVRVLARCVPKKAWNRISGFFGGYALVLKRFHAGYSSVEMGARTHSSSWHWAFVPTAAVSMNPSVLP